MASVSLPAEQFARRRRVRRSALVWTLIAVGFYLSFIALALVRALR
ncbi:MAG TPA: hypothetical protein VH109_03865 [Steroidobacteraceae bacterium]|jgi:hypothetical protein|nr:hypothetical protein [Steroidobacteraceae bacterium]